MALPWYENALISLGAGISLAFADRFFSENSTKNTSLRMERKMQEVTALEYLVENSDEADLQGTREYSESVVKARNYFERQGIQCDNVPTYEGLGRRISRKTRNAINHLRRGHERVNNLPWRGKLMAAYTPVFAIDVAHVAANAVTGHGNQIGIFASDLYQLPSLVIGLEIGRGYLWLKDKFVRSREEKELDSIGEDLTKDGKLLELVKNYAPTRELQVRVIDSEVVNPKALPSSDAQKRSYDATEIGQKVGDFVGDASAAVGRGLSSAYSSIVERSRKRKEAAEAAAEAERARLRKQYDQY